MDAVTIDPRQLAATCGVDLLTLESTFRQWADEEMSQACREAGIPTDIYTDYGDLDRFDEHVSKARAHLENAVATAKAFLEDNPDFFNEDEEGG